MIKSVKPLANMCVNIPVNPGKQYHSIVTSHHNQSVTSGKHHS